jgi:ribosomal protein S18 acetylase RimI-like enzyme
MAREDNEDRPHTALSSMLIRRAVKNDIPIILKLQQLWCAEDNVYGLTPDNYEQIVAALDSYFLVAEVGGDVIGFVSGSAHVSEETAVTPAGQSYLEIDNLYVVPQFRQQGVGGRLVDQLLMQAKEEGITHALVYSAAKDIRRILKFYEQHDFRSWYVQMFRKL